MRKGGRKRMATLTTDVLVIGAGVSGVPAAIGVETKCLPHDVVPSRLKPRLQQQELTPSPSRSEGNAGPGQSQ